MRYKNYSLVEYTNLLDKREFDFIMRFDKKFTVSIDVFNLGDFAELSFGYVKDLQYKANKGMTWIDICEVIAKIKKIKVKQVAQAGMLELCQQKNYIQEEIERINLVESTVLGHESEDEEIRAGLDRFDKYGHYLQLRELANNDITKIESVKQIKYSAALMELMVRKDLNDYEKELTRIRMSKNKN